MSKQMWATVIALGAVLALPSLASAQNQPGECASGFCGTPKNNGGGCGCGCGGSILVNNTDIGQTYSTSDDFDGDGFVDDFDNCPFIANRDQADADGDKIGDMCDNCKANSNYDQRDTDGDAIGDVCDPDIDNDTILNGADNCPAVPNKDQGDIDKNKIGDACDPDMDGDQVLNKVDNCPRVYNPDQKTDGIGAGVACDDDQDKDGISDTKDNCAEVYNPDQKDLDADGFGDACDLDIDGDNWPNNRDNCPYLANAMQTDTDHDGMGDDYVHGNAQCDTDGFCLHVGTNQGAACLDPKSVFAVTAAPRVKAKVGEQINLQAYSNRNAGITYQWVITDQPAGGNDAVIHPQTKSSVAATPFGADAPLSSIAEYKVDANVAPYFVASSVGTYKVTLQADIQNDTLFPNSLHAESTVEIDVDEGSGHAGGCSIATRSGAPAGFALLGLLIAGLAFRRRRS